MVIDGSMPVLLTSNSQLSRKVSKNHFVTGGNKMARRDNNAGRGRTFRFLSAFGDS
jgi:hypothetical protein